MLLTPAQIKPKSFELRRNSFFTRGGCISCLRACLGTRLLPQSYQYPNLSEGTDRIAGQLCGDKERPFSGLTKSGRVCRKVLESDARSLPLPLTDQSPCFRYALHPLAGRTATTWWRTEKMRSWAVGQVETFQSLLPPQPTLNLSCSAPLKCQQDSINHNYGGTAFEQSSSNRKHQITVEP